MKINLQLKELEELRTKLIGLRSINYADNTTKTSTKYNAQFAEILCNIECLEKKINDNIDRLVDKKHKIAKQIYALDNKDDVVVLFKRYVEYSTFQKIASEMAYSIRNIHYIHNRALKHFEEKYL